MLLFQLSITLGKWQGQRRSDCRRGTCRNLRAAATRSDSLLSIATETSAVFRGAKGDNATAMHSSVLTPRRGNNNIAQGRADAAVTPASAPPWVREQTKGQALKGRNRRTRTDAYRCKNRGRTAACRNSIPVTPLQGILLGVSVTQGGTRGCRRSALPWAILFGPFRAEY